MTGETWLCRCPEVKWLVHSYLYYMLDTPVYSDSQFDALSKQLLDNYDSVVVKYKDLITRDRLEAGSGFDIRAEQYPDDIFRLALYLRRLHEKYSDREI